MGVGGGKVGGTPGDVTGLGPASTVSGLHRLEQWAAEACHFSLSVLTLKTKLHLVVFMLGPLSKASRSVYTR